MWIFLHENYLKYFPFLHAKNYNLKCNTGNIEYSPNISALEKGESLEYTIENSPSLISAFMSSIDYRWTKENRGKEAEDNNSAGKLPASRSMKNKANESTAYRGHHVMKCEILQRGQIEETLRFGIFIK